MPSDATITLYEKHLNRYPDLDLSKPKDVYNHLINLKHNDKPLSPSTIKITICAIIWKLRKNKQPEELIEMYQSYNDKLILKTMKNDRDNTKTHGVIPLWKDIIKKRDSLKGIDKVLLSVYTFIPPRRLNDFELLKIVHKQPKDDDFNYYVLSSKSFVFNNYKTKSTFKQQIIKAPAKLHNIINDYVKENNIEDDTLLFDFKIYLRLKKLIGCSVDNLRHSFINNKYKRLTINSKTMEDMAYKMGHNLTTHLRYRKF